MKLVQITLLVVFFISCVANKAVCQNNANTVDNIVNSKKVRNIDQLVALLNSNFTDDSSKVRGAYVWIINNIRYDLAAVGKKKPVHFSATSKEKLEKAVIKYNIESANKTFSSKKGVCQNYSELLNRICELLNIKCVVVTGVGKVEVTDIGRNNKADNHAWNAVQINKKWKLIDATWGAGVYNEDTQEWEKNPIDLYFCMNPIKFADTHYPKDTSFLCLNYRFSKEEFFSTPVMYSDFYIQGYTLVQPKSGVVRANAKDEIVFNLGSNHAHRITYSLNPKKKPSEVVYSTDNKDEFTISTKDARGKILTLFSDNRSILRYKLEK